MGKFVYCVPEYARKSNRTRAYTVLAYGVIPYITVPIGSGTGTGYRTEIGEREYIYAHHLSR